MPVNKVSPKVLALLATLTLVWGTNWPMFAIALREMPVATFRTFVLSTAILMLYLVMRLRGESFAVAKGRWPHLIFASMMNITIWNVATSLAVLHIPSGHASVLAYTMPLWVALIGFVVFRQPLTGRLLLAILIGAAAVVALMVPNFASYANAPQGLFWGLSAGFCWAIGTFVMKRTSWPGMGLSLTFWQVVASWPPIALGMVVLDGWPQGDALDRGDPRHRLYRRDPDGAGHGDVVHAGQAPADAGRRAVLDRDPDPCRDQRRDRASRTFVLAAGDRDRLDRDLAVARPGPATERWISGLTRLLMLLAGTAPLQCALLSIMTRHWSGAVPAMTQ